MKGRQDYLDRLEHTVFQLKMSNVHRSPNWRRRQAKAVRENFGKECQDHLCFNSPSEFQLWNLAKLLVFRWWMYLRLS